MAALALAACATGFENFRAPAFSMQQATMLTDEQARQTIASILGSVRTRHNISAGISRFFEGWPADPEIRTPPMCEEILGYEPVKRIAFENLEFAYSPDQTFAVFSVFTDFAGAGCSDKPRGFFEWPGVSASEARQLSEALYALGARPRKAAASN
jgi:hypothetical protein